MNQEKGSRPPRYGFWGYFLLIIGLAGVSALLLIVFQRQLVDRGISASTAWLIWGGFFRLF
ncbi:hypothetical protein B4900_09585 [Yersinia rohdei]|nr:hypothetical protein B4900_09585 [Yersinia rohdei]